MKRILFACVHNAGRSQMAAAWVGTLGNPNDVEAISAGTAPAARVHPEVVRAMAEVGIDLSGVVPRRLTPELVAGVDVLVTLGCGEACPVVPGVEVVDWPLPDPAGASLETVRLIRDEIGARVEALLRVSRTGPPGARHSRFEPR